MPLVYDDTPSGKLAYDDAPRPLSNWELAKSLGSTGLQTVDDAMRAAGNAVSFGMADRLAGALEGTGTDEQVRLSEEARKRSPTASLIGDIGGAVLLPGIGGRNLAARLGGGWLGRTAGYGAEGAAIGAAQGAGTTYTGKPVDYLQNAATGGAVGGVLGAGMGSVFGPRGGMRSSAEMPTTPELRADKTARYTALENSPALYEPNALARSATLTEDVLRAQRHTPERSPISYQAIDEMRAPPTTAHLGIGAPIGPGDIEYIRKGLQQVNPVTGGPDIAAAPTVKRALDNFVRNPPPGAVIPGTERAAAEASALAESARQAHGAYRRSQLWDSLTDNALTSAGSANSGLNVQNRLRQVVTGGLRQNDKGQSAFSKAHYSPEEIARLTEFARVPRGDATLRYMDRLFGGGGGLGAMAAGGVAGGAADKYFRDDPTWGSIAGAGIPAAGLGLRLLGNRRATQQMQGLGNMVRERAPLYQERLATAPLVPPPGGGATASARDALTIELLRQQGLAPREE